MFAKRRHSHVEDVMARAIFVDLDQLIVLTAGEPHRGCTLDAAVDDPTRLHHRVGNVRVLADVAVEVLLHEHGTVAAGVRRRSPRGRHGLLLLRSQVGERVRGIHDVIHLLFVGEAFQNVHVVVAQHVLLLHHLVGHAGDHIDFVRAVKLTDVTSVAQLVRPPSRVPLQTVVPEGPLQNTPNGLLAPLRRSVLGHKLAVTRGALRFVRRRRHNVLLRALVNVLLDDVLLEGALIVVVEGADLISAEPLAPLEPPESVRAEEGRTNPGPVLAHLPLGLEHGQEHGLGPRVDCVYVAPEPRGRRLGVRCHLPQRLELGLLAAPNLHLGGAVDSGLVAPVPVLEGVGDDDGSREASLRIGGSAAAH
mmetsp:Transcript_55171/g.165314  ORF Transcript_55171/g.165314 Transcript_55171/m.165314 type:complete len:363 (-) Transcript_55171:1469-2557(-)